MATKAKSDTSLVVGIVVGVIGVAVGAQFVFKEQEPELSANALLCRSYLSRLRTAVRAEGSDTCREIDTARAAAERDQDDPSLVSGLHAAFLLPPNRCRSMSVEDDIARELFGAYETCWAAEDERVPFPEDPHRRDAGVALEMYEGDLLSGTAFLRTISEDGALVSCDHLRVTVAARLDPSEERRDDMAASVARIALGDGAEVGSCPTPPEALARCRWAPEDVRLPDADDVPLIFSRQRLLYDPNASRLDCESSGGEWFVLRDDDHAVLRARAAQRRSSLAQ